MNKTLSKLKAYLQDEGLLQFCKIFDSDIIPTETPQKDIWRVLDFSSERPAAVCFTVSREVPAEVIDRLSDSLRRNMGPRVYVHKETLL